MNPEQYNFRDYDNIDRESPVLAIEYGEAPMKLTYDNTAIFSFGAPYEFMTSIFHNDPERGVMSFFDSDALLEQLRGYGFPEYREPFPAEQDVEAYFTWQSQVLENELGGLALGNEVEDFEVEEEDPPGYRPEDWGFED